MTSCACATCIPRVLTIRRRVSLLREKVLRTHAGTFAKAAMNLCRVLMSMVGKAHIYLVSERQCCARGTERGNGENLSFRRERCVYYNDKYTLEYAV